MRLQCLRNRLIRAGIVVLGVTAFYGLNVTTSKAAESKISPEEAARARACSGATGSVFTLIQVANSNDPNPFDTTYDQAIVARKVGNQTPVTMTTGGTRCGTLQDGSGLVDTNYPTNGTYNGYYSLIVRGDGKKPARVTFEHYWANSNPSPGTKFLTLATMDAGNPCTLMDVNNNTNYFYKICMNQNTNVRAVRLP